MSTATLPPPAAGTAPAATRPAARAAPSPAPAEATPRPLSIRGACRRLNISRSTVHQAIRQGILRSVKVGRRVMIPVASVEAFRKEIT